MSAISVTAPPAPAPEPQRHTWLQSLTYHLLPGLAPLAAILALAPLVERSGLPPILAIYLGAFLGVMPVQLGILYYLGYRRNGRLSLEGIVLFRNRVKPGQMLLLVLGLFVWSALVMALLGPILNKALLPAFQWMPSVLTNVSEDFSAFSRTIALTSWVIGLLGAAWLAPTVEELYFRGFLMPRMPVARAWAPVANAALFSAYHFLSPWQVVQRTLAVSALGYAVQKKESLWLSILTHCLLNSVGMIASLVLILR